MPSMAEIRTQPVSGVVPPQLSEALIREVWPSVTTNPAVAGAAKRFVRSVFLAPVGWLILAPLYFKKLLGVVPGLGGMAERYTLTNRRLMTRRGMKPVPAAEVPLDQIKDVRLVTDANSEWYLTATLEILGEGGTVLLTLPGVGEPESFRQTILQAATAWGPLLAKKS